MSRPTLQDSRGGAHACLLQSVQSAAVRLELSAWAMADSLRAGSWVAQRTGPGVEVSGVREYQAGDEVRSVDWRVTARRGSLFVREFSSEKDLPLLLILHLSPTLGSGRGPAKTARALEVAAVLAAVGLRAGDRVGVLRCGKAGAKRVKPAGGRIQLPRILSALGSPPDGRPQQSLSDSLREALFLLGERGRVLVISDGFGLTDGDDGPRESIHLLSLRHSVLPIRILDRAEGRLPATGSFPLRDPRTHRQLVFPTQTRGRQIEEQLERTREQVDAFFGDLGLGVWDVFVNEPLQGQLESHLRSRSGVSRPLHPRRHPLQTIRVQSRGPGVGRVAPGASHHG